MPSWWGKFSSKEAKKKATRESFIDTLHKKFKSLDGNSSTRSGVLRRRSSDIVSDQESHSRAQTRSPSPSKYVERCQSFSGRPQGYCSANVCRTRSCLSELSKPKVEKASKTSLFRPLPRPSCIRQRLEPDDMDAEEAVASISSESSMETDDLADSSHFTLLVTDDDAGARTPTSTLSNIPIADRSIAPVIPTESKIMVKLSCNQSGSPPPSRRRLMKGQVPNACVPHRCPVFSAPDSSMSSPSRSPIRGLRHELVAGNTISSGKHHTDFAILGSGQCSSAGSGQTSGQNSMVGDTFGQLFWQSSRGSPEYSPNPSPRMRSPGPSSRIQSGAVTPIHPRSGVPSDSVNSRPDDGKQQSHRLPLPPLAISNSTNFSHQNLAVTSPSVSSPTSRWRKGKLLGQGTFGHVYVGFNCETGQMCAMKEVTLFADDAKSKESAKQLGQEIASLSRFSHPNIVQYYGSGMVGDKFYVYLEYLSGGSIHKILSEYGRLGESAIRSYTKQILSGLAYLHAKNTVHRDIKGANILVDPNGRVKLADFGMAKHIAGKYCPLSFKGSPYWMAPEVITNSNGCSLAVDIWSLGCTILEMATSKPPWSQYEGVAAMFKIGNSKELPTIPDHLSDEGKEFVRLCLQRNPIHRPTAAQLLEHPFVKGASSVEKPIISCASSDRPNAVKSMSFGNGKSLLQAESEKLVIHSSRIATVNFHSSDFHVLRNVSCPVSPLGSPLLNSRSPQQLSGRMSPSPISSPRNRSGSSTPTGGIGAIPFRNQVTLSQQERVASLQRPDVLRGVPFGANALLKPSSHESNGLKNQYGRRNGSKEVRNGQSILVDRAYLSSYSKIH